MSEQLSGLTRLCAKCGFEQPFEHAKCASCGVIFGKLGEEVPRSRRPERAAVYAEEGQGLVGELLRRALSVSDKINEIELGGRALVWLALFLLSWSFVLTPIERSQVSPTFVHFILSRVNLVFHEAGHIVFSVLGQFMATLGGSLLQVLIPLICVATFLTRHLNPFGASVTLWWAGQSLIDLAPYINDARAQQMILLGGVTGRDVPGYHDWNNILSRLGLLTSDHLLARLAHLCGSVLIVVAVIWGAYLLLLQYRLAKASR